MRNMKKENQRYKSNMWMNAFAPNLWWWRCCSWGRLRRHQPPSASPRCRGRRVPRWCGPSSQWTVRHRPGSQRLASPGRNPKHTSVSRCGTGQTCRYHQPVEENKMFLWHGITDWKRCTLYAVKVQRSLAPLSRFSGSHIPSAHEQQCCRFQSYANSVRSPMKFTSEIYIAWTTFLGSTTTDHVLTSCDVGL